MRKISLSAAPQPSVGRAPVVSSADVPMYTGARATRRLASAWLAAILGAVSASGASRDANLGDLSLEQLMEIPVLTVVSASRFEQKTTRAPASVSVVASDAIAAFGHRTLAEVLRSVRGLHISDDGNYSYLGVRGFLRPGDYNTRVLVLLDGHRINDNIYDAVYYGQENMVDVDAIERVEVVRGPSSSVYGNSAFFGVVNVVTKRGAGLDGAEFSAEHGSFGTYHGRASYGRRIGRNGDLFVTATYHDSQGRSQIYYREFDERRSTAPEAAHGGIAQDADAERARSVFARLRMGELTLGAFWSTRMKQVPAASFATVFNDPRERTDDRRGYLDLQHESTLGSDTQWLNRVSWDYYDYRGDYPFFAGVVGKPPIELSKDEALGHWLNAETQLTTKLAGRHTIVAGAELRHNFRQRQLSYIDTKPRTVEVDDDRSSHTIGLYAQAEIVLRPEVLLNAGLRYDDHADSFGSTVNPRLGLIVQPTATTTLKALFGQAFRAPNIYERCYYPPPAGATLGPERIRTTELALEHDFARHLRLTLSAYRFRVRDLITQIPTATGEFYFANLDRVSTTGGECELEARSAAGWHARVSYALQRTTDESTGALLTHSPRHLAKLGLQHTLVAGDRLLAGLELQYQSAVRTLAGGEARGFWLSNLSVTTRIPAARLEASAGLYNLFNTQYTYPGAADHLQDVLPQPGRTFRVKLTWKY